MPIRNKEELEKFVDQILLHWKKTINLFHRKRISIHIDSIGFPSIITIRYAGLCEKKYVINKQTLEDITFDFEIEITKAYYAKHYAHYKEKERLIMFNMDSKQLNGFIKQIEIKIYQHLSPQQQQKLKIYPTSLSPARILIQFDNIYQKDYIIQFQKPEQIASDFKMNLFNALCESHKKEEQRFAELITQLTIRLNRNTPPDNWKYLVIMPVGIESIQIQFADVYKKVYQIVNQTPEEIASDFERNLFEELYKLYKKGVIPNE